MRTSTTARAATKRHRNFRGEAFLVLHLPRGECGPHTMWKFATAGPSLPLLWDGAWNWGRPWQRASSSTYGTSRLTTPAWPTVGWWCGWTAGTSIGERVWFEVARCPRASGEWNANCGGSSWLPGNATANERAALSLTLCASYQVLEGVVWVVKLRPSALVMSSWPVAPLSWDLLARPWWKQSVPSAAFQLFSQLPGYLVSYIWRQTV